MSGVTYIFLDLLVEVGRAIEGSLVGVVGGLDLRVEHLVFLVGGYVLPLLGCLVHLCHLCALHFIITNSIIIARAYLIIAGEVLKKCNETYL